MSDQGDTPQMTPKAPWPNRLEADVTFSDGTVHRVIGHGAVEYHKNPAVVGPQLEIGMLRYHIRMLRKFVEDAVTWDATCEWVDAAKKELAQTETLQ